MNNDKKLKYWDECVKFHGHECPGLAIGYRAALYASDLFSKERSKDEEFVCVAENDACGIDAIQVILGCSAGKGNLLFHITGKSAYSFYDRLTGKSFRLVLKPGLVAGKDKEEIINFYKDIPIEEMFDIKKVNIELPVPAKIFNSYKCDNCGEITGEKWIHFENGKKLCPDCYRKYDRFNI